MRTPRFLRDIAMHPISQKTILQADHLMSRVSVSDIPAYRPFIRRMSVSDKLTLPIIITKNWPVSMDTEQSLIRGCPGFENATISEPAGVAIHVRMR